MILYHGTRASCARILDEGIRPRGRRPGNWQHTVTSSAQTVYLTTCYGLYFAAHAASAGGIQDDAIIVELDTDRLDLASLVPDEDVLEQALRGRDQVRGDLKRRTRHYRRLAATLGGTDYWRESLAAMGTCGHLGTVPVEAITRVVLVPQNLVVQYMLRAYDPVINLMNHQVMGERYRQFHRWLFDGGDGFPQLTRDGLGLLQNTKGAATIASDALRPINQ